MHLAPRSSASSGWVPATILAIATAIVVVGDGASIGQVAIFSVYVAFGIALPGLLWVRFLRGRAGHIAEDVALGLCAGYAIEIATYLVTRALGAPLLFLAWPIATLVAFMAVPGLRSHWRGSGIRAPAAWSWSLAAILGILLAYTAGIFFARHHLTGTDAPYVDMAYHLALIGELRFHVPPEIPYVTGVPLAYHWFFYAEAAATSWATGIEPIVLLYRLSGLPMFAAFVVLTALAARRLTDRWWTGPLAVAVALFAVVAGPYGWAVTPVLDNQPLYVAWISPTTLFGLALFAALVLLFIDVLGPDLQTDADDTNDSAAARTPLRLWLLIVIVLFAAAGAKASLLPLLFVGLLAVIVGVAVSRRRLHRDAAIGLGLTGVGLVLAIVLLFRMTSGGLVIGLESLRSFPVVALIGARGAGGVSALALPLVALLVAVVLWSLMWAGAFGLIIRRRGWAADPRLLLLLGICFGAVGAVVVFSYPGLSQTYYLKGATGAFGILTAVGIAAVVPLRSSYRTLIGAVIIAALVGALAVLAIGALGPSKVPSLSRDHLSGVLPVIVLPVVALLIVVALAYAVLRRAEPRWPVLRGAVPLLVIALAMGFSIPNLPKVVVSPIFDPPTELPIAAEGIDAARWLRDHSDPNDLVATNLHCRPLPDRGDVCDARHFWVSGYSERRMLVEGWAYTTKAIAAGLKLGVSDRTAPFWDPVLLAANDAAFRTPTEAAVAALRDEHGVRWMFADLTTADAAGLARVADLRYQAGDYAVYAVRASP
jgi:hypothetical protein